MNAPDTIIEQTLSTGTIASTTKNRHTDIATDAVSDIKPSLPFIDWAAIGKSAPVRIPIGSRYAEDELPYADWVVITWTTAEWQAFDHVFLNSSTADKDNNKWQDDWHQYSKGSSSYPFDEAGGKLWGLFQLVQVTDESNRPWRVLLFKSNTHLAYSPWAAGLTEMINCILTDTKADRLYSIGTAGGARFDQSLGDAVITNNTILNLQQPPNTIDKANGNSFRCPTWYPNTSLANAVEEKLLMKLNTVVTRPVLEDLFKQLQTKYAGDASFAPLQLDDLLNEALNPDDLNKPKIHSLENVPLLTTDFYYTGRGNNSAAFACLEMDDAVIANAANAMGVRFAFVRNISDPIVPDKTKTGALIKDAVREDWSGFIYSNFGLYSSFNGALAAWTTIAGEGTTVYNPARFTPAPAEDDPLEIKLVYQVRSCGTCNFFWPEEKSKAGYGPYTAFDFDVNVPYESAPLKDAAESPWLLGRTRPPAFPNGEIVDGCRKAPIMTIGINPNLTAFSPGQNGTAWAYPDFTSDNNTNAWAKYAWYYRYRSVYQEKVSLDFVKRFVLADGQITALHAGKIVSAPRADASYAWKITVHYQGDAANTDIAIPGVQGDFPYMLFYDQFAPNNTFEAGALLAGKVAVPEGIQVEIQQEEQGYYMQFLPTLKQFQNYLVTKGHTKANLKIGEDVSQLDMVACASPHWTEGYLGKEMKTIVDNCVSKNAWAIKQMVQTRPSILYIVSQSSWNMFYDAFGKFVEPGKISANPVDQSYTLLRETTNLEDPVYINFDITLDGIQYKSKTRLVITPHFSFDTNFLPQYRLSPASFAAMEALPDFKTAITYANGFTILPADPQHPDYYREIQLYSNTAAASRENFKNNYPDLYNSLEPYYYDAHALMAAVLNKMYDDGELTYDDTKNYLQRTEGACKFCVNEYWQLPFECRYNKPAEQSPPPGYLEKVAAYIVANGKPETHTLTAPAADAIYTRE